MITNFEFKNLSHTRFIIKTLQIFDEELVERYQAKPPAEVFLSSKVKDFVREGQIGPIVTVLLQVIANYELFPKKSVKGTLKVLGQLIDWNELHYFESLIKPCQEFVKVKGYRAGALACLGAIAGKGMEPVQKMTLIKQLEFMELLASVQIKYPTFSFDED